MSSGIILYLVEGKQERSLNSQVRSLSNLNGIEILPDGYTIVYGTCIYGLFKEVEKFIDEDEDFDLFNILKGLEKRHENQNLPEISKHDISEIYLIFDYDPHVGNFNEDKIKKMCEIFNDEYSTGKLFINYPMIEVFRHCYKMAKLDIPFINTTCPLAIVDLVNYKKYVSDFQPDIIHIDCTTTIKKVLKETILKSNLLINSQYSYPEDKSSINQKEILDKQISLIEDFHLLSGIPLLIHHYHRDEFLREYLLTPENESTIY
ncbi:hypothetical protein [Acinetobacter pittii]|uniref:hypothetical protein n=1 Tax=Acinetobacter pittii TaxID=48296 RepID=UPI001F4669D0|nr:hypothetical protein [Acinetobacter pittii]MCE6237764.1 hypothetical protein [Acinetobacter pittii]MCE6692621.1 hypothetical protein [Acinetobacter pittii]MCE6700071.1 hypothetical protein [Acinetobacter pittii]